MSTSIEQRVVQMRFDNKQFEAGVAQSMSTLDKFRAKLNFKGAAKGFDDINRAAAKVSLQPMADQVDRTAIKFDGLAVIAATALSRITNAAINTGKNMVKALTLDPVMTGFSEYETKLNSIQTIMSNTASKGTTMEDVTRVIDELNAYADKTIYNFAEMTRNIGTFTAAGVGLEESAKAIQGIANLAAASGSNSQQASTAMYQLSQALASGTVRLMDWNSVVNAGMGGEKFQNALKQTAREHGIAIDEIIEKQGSFRESLQLGWLSADIMSETLNKFTVKGAKEYAQAMLESGKYTQAQADALIAEAQAMEDAATKVKTFTQLWSTLQEAVQSGWGKTWEILVGDFEEAKELFTNISNVIGGFIDASADARNEMLQGWKDLGGRTAFINTLSKAFENFTNVVGALSNAFRDIFPRITAQQLFDVTLAIKNFVYSLTLSEDAINTLRIAFKALLLPVQAVVQVVRIGIAAFGTFVQVCFKLVDALLALPSRIGKVNDPFKKLFGGERYARIVKSLSTLTKGFGDVRDRARELLGAFTRILNSGFTNFIETLSGILKPFGEWVLDRIVDGFEALSSIDFSAFGKNGLFSLKQLSGGFSNITKICENAKNTVSNFLSQFKIMSPMEVLNGISNSVSNIFTNISNFFKRIDISPVINPVVEKFNFLKDIIIKVATAISDFTGKLTAAKILIFGFGVSLITFIFKLTSVLDQFAEVATGLGRLLTGAGGVLNSTSRLILAVSDRVQGDKLARNIIPMAAAITLLAASLIVLSRVDPEGLKQATISVVALIGAFTGMVALLSIINKLLAKTPQIMANLQEVGIAMLAMAGSVAILSGSLLILSKVDMGGIGIKLVTLIGLIGIMVISIIAVGKLADASLGKAAAILAFAGAIALIAHVIAEISKEDVSLSLNVIIALVAIIAMLKGLTNQVRGVRFSGGVGILLLVLSLGIFSKNLLKLSKYDPGELVLGLTNFIPIFITLKLLSNVIGSGKGMAKLGGQVLAISVSILVLQNAIKNLGKMDVGVVIKGGLVVSALILVFGLMQRLANMGMKETAKIKGSFISMSLAILILGLAINYIGGLSLKNVVQGTAVVSLLLTLLAALATLVGPAHNSTKAIIALTVCLGLLISAIALLTLIDSKDLLYSSAAISMAMIALGAMIKLIGDIKIGAAFSKVGLLTIVFVELGFAFEKLRALSPTQMMTIATALSEVMMALGITVKLFRGMDAKGPDLAKTGAMIVGMLAAAGLAVYALNQMPIQEGLIEKVSALSILLIALGSISILMSKFNAGFVSTGSAGFGIAEFMAILALTLTALGGLFSLSIGGYSLASFLETGINTINSMYKIVPAIAVIGLVAGVFSKINIDIVACGTAAFGIGVFMAVLTLFITLIGAFFQAFPDLEASLDRAVQVFPKIGAALGGLVGGFGQGLLAALTGGIMESLKGIATAFSDFITNLGPFLEGLKEVDASKVTAVSSLGTMILALTASDILNSINPFVKDDPLAELGSQLVEFGPKFAEFAASISGINTEAVNSCATALKAFADVVIAIPQDVDFLGIFSKTTNFEGFGEGMKTFAEGFKTFAEVIDTSTLSEDTVNRTSYAMKALTDMANNIPSSGGLLQDFFGGKDMKSFGTQLKDYATGLIGFFKIISGQDTEVGAVAVDFGLVTKCANASKALADFATNIPSTGGRLQKITGIKNMTLFGTQLSGYAAGLVSFFNILNGKDTEAGPVDIDKGLVNKATYAGSAFAELAKQLPGSGGIWQAFVGSLDLETFGDGIGKFGQGIYDFFTLFKSAKITDDDVTTAQNAGKAFSELVNSVKPNEGAITIFKNVNLELYGTELKGFGEGIKSFYDSIKQIDFTIVDNAIASLNGILGIKESLADISAGYGGALNLKSYLTALADTGLEEFGTAFSNGEDKIRTSIETVLTSAMETAAFNIKTNDIDFSVIIDAILKSLSDGTTEIGSMAFNIASWFKTSFDARKSLFELCGATIIESIYSGASVKLSEYSVKFTELTSSIISLFNEGLGIVGQTSTKFHSIGKYCMTGFIKGFEGESTDVNPRVRTVANNFVKTTAAVLEVNSPSERFREIGEYCIQGLVKGIDDNIKLVTSGAIKMGKNLLNSVKRFFEIKSPSRLMRDEVGRYIVEGIADGITNNTSAEEAASKKAQNIVNAFKTEFDKLDQVLNTKNLEYELWQSMNPNAPSSEANVKQLEMLDNQLKIQAERVNAANAQYQATLKSLGENATETREAYNAYLEEKIGLADLASQMQDMQRNNTDAFLAFDRTYRQLIVDMGDMGGITNDDLRRYAIEQTGWIDSRTNTINMRGSIEEIMDRYLSSTTAGTADVETVIVNSTSNAMIKSAAIANQGGKGIVNALATGVGSNGSVLTDAITTVVGDAISYATGTGDNVAKGYFDGVLDGANSFISTTGTKAVKALSQIIPMLNAEVGVNSPSKFTYETGMYVIQGFINGLNDGASLSAIASSAAFAGSQALTAFTSQISEYPGIGAQMMSGLANGIISGAGLVISAVSNVARQAVAISRSILAIHSPSRVYYQIGEYMDQGLANGIIDNASIVTDAISRVLNKAQDTINANKLYVSPVVSDQRGINIESPRSSSWNWLYRDRVEDYAQLLQWDASGNLIPTGYGNSGMHPENGAWWIAPSLEIAEAIRDMADKEALEALRRQANKGEYEGTVEDLKAAIAELASKPSIEYNQTINSPKNVNAADVARATNTQLSGLKISPSYYTNNQSIIENKKIIF